MMEEATRILSNELESRGWRFSITPLRRLRELEGAIERLHESGGLDEAFYRERLARFEFAPPADFPEARSILAVAVPQPAVRAFFGWKGGEIEAIVPPTYRSRVDADIEALLRLSLADRGHRFVKAKLPLKQLAVRSGLGAYGRNNVCYLPGKGSFNRLAAFFTDIPCGRDPWRDEAMMERCSRCSACAATCPTKCISPGRFLIGAERCLAYLNESAAPEFPAWLDPASHRCLVGCMACQEVCPENRDFLDRTEDAASFSEEETRAIMSRVPPDRLPAALAGKLRAIDLLDDYGILPRNLRALIAARGRSKEGTKS
jgi:epoxyqueuosine reductase